MPQPASRDLSTDNSMTQRGAVAENPWWYSPEQQGSYSTLPAGAASPTVAFVCGIQRRLSTIQERCEATEAMCKEALAKMEEVQKEKAAMCDGVREGRQAVASLAGEIMAGLEVASSRIGHMEDQFTKGKTDTASEFTAMKLKIEELSKRMNMMLSPHGHGWHEVFRQFRNLDVQMSGLPDIDVQLSRFPAISEHSHQQQQQQQQQTNTIKFPQHHSLGCLHRAVSTNFGYLLRRCSSDMALPTPCPVNEVHAAVTNNIGTFDAKLQGMLVSQLPCTGESSNAKNPPEHLSCRSESVTTGSISSLYSSSDTTSSTRLSSEPGPCLPSLQTVQRTHSPHSGRACIALNLQAPFPLASPLMQHVQSRVGM